MSAMDDAGHPTQPHTDWQGMALAAASSSSSVAFDLIDAVRDDCINQFDNVGSLDTLTLAVDAMRLMIDVLRNADPSLIVERSADIAELEAACANWLDPDRRDG